MSSLKVNHTKTILNNCHHFLHWAEIIMSIVLFAVLALFTYTEIFLKPYLGFSVNWSTGLVTSIDPVAEDHLQIDDQILSINKVPPWNINTTIQGNPIIHAHSDEKWDVLLIRHGEKLNVQYPKPNQSEQTFLNIISGDWILPYPFFAAGIIIVLFIRPRTITRLLLILFFYTFALWISAGLISPTGYWESSIIMRVFVWLSLPIAFQLHWRFPIPFKFNRHWINITAYSLTLLLVIWEILSPNPNNAYIFAFLLTLVSSFTMLVIKHFRFKAHRKILRPLLFAYFLAVLPLVVMGIRLLIGSVPFNGNIALMGLTAIPGLYFFTGHRIHLRRNIPRVNFFQKLFTIGILLTFLINFLFQSLPATTINPLVCNIVSFLTIVFISITGFGALLIMPALANDQVNLFETETYTLRLSANRTAAFIIFLLLVASITLTGIFLITNLIDSSTIKTFWASLVSISITIASAHLYKPYRKFFDRIILGIQQPPEELIRSYAQSISVSLERNALENLLKDEILPSLLIRESLLFYAHDNSHIMTLFKTGLTSAVVSQMKEDATPYFHDPNEKENLKTIINKYPWIRVALPLEIKNKKIGLWFFGRRDPNDSYNSDFIKDLNSLANQTTLALLNIHQAELLQSLYNTNVNRQEEEKANLARDLHDVLLPSIGYLVELQNSDCSIEEFEQAVQHINNMIRNMTSGLRPATLDMGLAIALEELADEPKAQIGGEITIQTRLMTPEPVAYHKKAELHLYRMVQQASQNALEHAQAKKILIHGTLLPDSLDLHVQDDGIGFHIIDEPDLSSLIAQQHFGLANIFERAKIVGANVKIDSQLNQGTCVHINWKPQDYLKNN